MSLGIAHVTNVRAGRGSLAKRTWSWTNASGVDKGEGGRIKQCPCPWGRETDHTKRTRTARWKAREGVIDQVQEWVVIRLRSQRTTNPFSRCVICLCKRTKRTHHIVTRPRAYSTRHRALPCETTSETLCSSRSAMTLKPDRGAGA